MSESSIFNRLVDKIKSKQSNTSKQSAEDIKKRIHQRFNSSTIRSLSKSNQLNVNEILDQLRNISSDISQLYLDYEVMSTDTTIAAALELYADDTCQFNTDTGKIFEVSCPSDRQLEQDITNLFNSLDINSRIWRWAYQLAKYGDFYLRNIIKVTPYGRVLLIDENTNPSRIFDLSEVGMRVGFAESTELNELDNVYENNGLSYVSNNSYIANRYQTYKGGYVLGQSRSDQSYKIYGPESFIHFSLMRESSNIRIDITDFDNTDEYGQYLKRIFTVSKGTSMLKAVLPDFRILQLLENAVILTKLAKSEVIRLLSVEVGDLDEDQVTELLTSIQDIINARTSVDLKRGSLSNTIMPKAMNNPVVYPTRDGKGSISHEVIGGDIDVGSLEDLRYFTNKLFSGLKIPKSLMGYEEAISASIGGESELAELDIRYAKSVKKIQLALSEGLKYLAEIWVATRGIKNGQYYKEGKIYSTTKTLNESGKYETSVNVVDEISVSKLSKLLPPDFSIKFNNPSSSEELKRLQELKTRFETINDIITQLSTASDNKINTAKIYKILLKKYIPDNRLTSELSKELDKASEAFEKQRELELTAINKLDDTIDDTDELSDDDLNNILDTDDITKTYSDITQDDNNTNRNEVIDKSHD